MKTLLFLTFSFNLFAFNEKFVNDYIFKAKELKTEAFVLIKDGKLVYSKFEYGDMKTLHTLWSMTKSVSGILFGIAQDKGFISKNDLVSYDFPGFKSKTLTYNHVLQMSSGIDWNEFYEKDPFNSDVVRMLYFATAKEGVMDYMQKRPFKSKPGKNFYYSSGDSNILTGALAKRIPKELKLTYPWKWLFDPMEINAYFETDSKGVFMASSYLYMSLEDLIKFALMILNEGKHKNKQIVSKEFIHYIRQINPASKEKCTRVLTYGAQFWLNKPCEGKRLMPTISENVFAMLGHGGQSIFFDPQNNLLALRISHDVKGKLKYEKYLNLIYKGLGI
ncbi:MAG: beta-lactamase family protein [Bacteriovoracaceae bacterium]|jgi:CubicO group peptidase (beta-lactamase class C family)|nr:beta-lactamase family protein [Bacteriovoracaceae bacterium]